MNNYLPKASKQNERKGKERKGKALALYAGGSEIINEFLITLLKEGKLFNLFICLFIFINTIPVVGIKAYHKVQKKHKKFEKCLILTRSTQSTPDFFLSHLTPHLTSSLLLLPPLFGRGNMKLLLKFQTTFIYLFSLLIINIIIIYLFILFIELIVPVPLLVLIKHTLNCKKKKKIVIKKNK